MKCLKFGFMIVERFWIGRLVICGRIVDGLWMDCGWIVLDLIYDC